MNKTRAKAIKLYWNIAKERCPFHEKEIVNGFLEGFIDCAEYLLLQIAELEKENTELKRHIKADCIDCEDYYKNKRLEKENAELKEENRQLDSMLTGESLVSNERKEQLTYAKELLAKWVELFKPKSNTALPTPIQVDTEQFLKETGK